MRQYNRNAQICGLCLDVLLVIAMIGLLLCGYVKTKNYVPVDATLLDICTEYGVDTSSETTRHSYGYYEYTYDGIRYVGKRSEIPLFTGKIGKTVVVRRDPNVPEILEDVMERRLETIILIISALGTFVIGRSILSS